MKPNQDKNYQSFTLEGSVYSRNSYDVNLQSTGINGEIVNVGPSVFRSNDGENPTVDSGARFVYLGDRAYDPVISALKANVSRFAESRMSGNGKCFLLAERFQTIQRLRACECCQFSK